jgi:hypothetical protein
VGERIDLDENEQIALQVGATAGADEELRDAAFEYAGLVDPDKQGGSQDEVEDALAHLRMSALQFAALIFAQRR